MTTPAAYSGPLPDGTGDTVYADPGDGILRRVPGTVVLSVLQTKKVIPADITALDPETMRATIEFYNGAPPKV